MVALQSITHDSYHVEIQKFVLPAGEPEELLCGTRGAEYLCQGEQADPPHPL